MAPLETKVIPATESAHMPNKGSERGVVIEREGSRFYLTVYGWTDVLVMELGWRNALALCDQVFGAHNELVDHIADALDKS